MKTWAKLAIPLTLALWATGCRIGGSTSVDDVTNQLRAENSKLRKQNEELRQMNSELVAKTARAPRESKGALDSEELQALPRCTQITLDSLSGIVPRTSQLYLYLKTLDGTSNFVQVVGRVSLKITRGSESIIEQNLTPRQLRDAFRSGITGTYYLLDCGKRNASELNGAKIEITFEDALTGSAQTCNAVLDAKGHVELKGD